MIVLAGQNGVETVDRVPQRHELARVPGEHFRNLKRLRQEPGVRWRGGGVEKGRKRRREKREEEERERGRGERGVSRRRQTERQMGDAE